MQLTLPLEPSAAGDPPSSMPPAPPQPDAPVFVRHARARRYLIRVQMDGTVRVTLPRWGSVREARAFVAHETAWIAEQRARREADRARAANHLVGPEVERALRARAARELPARLRELAAQHGLTVTRISIRNQRRRWGSCSPTGHICLNWRLTAMPETVRDYVLIHELMHLRQMNHSPAFWALVAEACPDYRAARAWLRAHVRG